MNIGRLQDTSPISRDSLFTMDLELEPLSSCRAVLYDVNGAVIPRVKNTTHNCVLSVSGVPLVVGVFLPARQPVLKEQLLFPKKVNSR